LRRGSAAKRPQGNTGFGLGLVLVFEMPNARENHRNAVRVAGGDGFCILDGAAGLDYCGYSGGGG
jgi:hypothetical protein